MKNIVTTLLFFMAFSLSANAQETKKDACCASGKKTETASTNTGDKAKCDVTAKGAKCDAKATMTADAKSTEAVLPKAEAVTDKKACKSKGSCCASKAEAKKA